MIQKYTELGPLEEALALTTTSENKNIIFGALVLEGSVRSDLAEKAVKSLGHIFPHLKACLKETKIGLRYHLERSFNANIDLPFYFEECQNERQSSSTLDLLVESLESRMNDDRDLFKDPLVEFFLIKRNDERYLMACVMNHVAGDAVTLTSIVKEFVKKYQELLARQGSQLSECLAPSSIINKRSGQKRITTIADYWSVFKQAIIPYQKCSGPFGTGIPGARNESYVKRLLSQEETEYVLKMSKKFRIPFVDYLLAGMSWTIDTWNNNHNVSCDKITGALTVNMQGRFKDRESPNNDSILYFGFDRAVMSDFSSLALYAYRQRIGLHRDQMDLKYSKGLGKINKILSILPFHLRQKIMIKILQKHQTSFALGFLGVLWPCGRRINSDSYLVSAGDFEITEAHGVAFNIVSRTPLYLAAYFFRKRLNLILSAAAWKFSRDETEEFIDLLVTTLIDPSRVR